MRCVTVTYNIRYTNKKSKTGKRKGAIRRNKRPQPIIRLCIAIMWRKGASPPVGFPARLARQLWRRAWNIVKRGRAGQGRSCGCTVWISSGRRLAVRSNARQSRSRSPVMSQDRIRDGHASFRFRCALAVDERGWSTCRVYTSRRLRRP